MSPGTAGRRWRLVLRLAGAALTWSIGLVAAAVLVPAFDDQTITNANGLTLTTATFVQANGAWVLVPVLAPAVLTVGVALALGVRRRGTSRWAAPAARVMLGLLLALALFSLPTLGGLILPVVVLLGLALGVAPAGDRVHGQDTGRPPPAHIDAA